MDFHLAICLEILDHHPKAPTNYWFIVTQFFAPQVLLNDQRIFHVFPWVSPADCRLQGAIKDGFWVSPFKSKTGGSFGHVGNVSDIHHPQKLATCPSLIESSQIFQLALPNLSKSYFSKKYPQIKGISKSEKKKKKKTLEDIHHPFVPLGKNTKTSTVCSPCLLLEFHTAILRAPGGRCLCPCQCGLFGWQIEAAFLFATGRDVGSSIKTLESFPEVKKKTKQTWHFMLPRHNEVLCTKMQTKMQQENRQVKLHLSPLLSDPCQRQCRTTNPCELPTSRCVEGPHHSDPRHRSSTGNSWSNQMGCILDSLDVSSLIFFKKKIEPLC